VRIDPKTTAVDLSRAAKMWQSLGDEKVVVGRKSGDHDELRRLSCLLDAVGALVKARELWLETAKALRELGSASERPAAVADQQAGACSRQVEFCGESVHELVMERVSNKERPLTPFFTRIAAYEYERHADHRSINWLIARFLEDPVLRRREAWGEQLDLWWLPG